MKLKPAIMKETLLFTTLLISSFCSAQLGLEHVYYNTSVTRIVLENSGEKYYWLNRQAGRFEFFNADYSPWKNVPVVLPSQTWSVYVPHISETKIDPDDKLEISYSTFSSAGNQSKIINELGTVLLSVDNCIGLRLDEKAGLVNKIIAATGVIYAVPGLVPEHTYPTMNLNRVKLENSGEKYYVLDVVNSLVALYNADHSFWKSIVLPKPDGYNVSNIIFLSEHQINADDLIEVGYRCSSNTQKESRIINENASPLLTLSDADDFRISTIDGLPNKLMVDYINSDIYAEYDTHLYSLPDLNFEHTYPAKIERIKLENSGEKYFAKFYDPNTTEIMVYNSDHSPWKTIVVPVQNPEETIQNVSVSETKIDSDNQLEAVYSIWSNTLDGGHYDSSVVKEDGTVLLSIPGASEVLLSEFPNCANKMIAYVQSGLSFDDLHYHTYIYGFNGTTFATEDFSMQHIVIAPNPASTVLNVTSKTNIVEATLHNIFGTQVQHVNFVGINAINVGELADGIYLLTLSDENHQQSVHKIMVLH
ncbi:T9SS type A sorting domain-containing protein [Flavobacterium sp.]|uniref:T9SS type A sorting domain-containing protein n=1 Tax=Flavobacterium sp. TaxID=239 RepID=UPI002869F81D|nr:T9SS type A sorting domain-containing protein [Flavobacterium sp.]